MAPDFGLDIRVDERLAITYGADMFGPEPEQRSLAAIRGSLRDPGCTGPDPVYSIVMDVGRPRDRAEIVGRGLLFGVVGYAAGRLGDEPVRSQGHVHKKSRNSGWPAPEIFEIWRGRAIIYMQESDGDDPGRCHAVSASPGDRVVVPPGWAHAVISADPREGLIFGAWCDRDYGFVYDGVRAHGGLAWFPLLTGGAAIQWEPNPSYRQRPLEQRQARAYPELGLDPAIPLYSHIDRKPAAVEWVAHPDRAAAAWESFEP